MKPLVSPELDRYLSDLLPSRDPLMAEMEREAQVRDIPIVGPAVAALLEILATSLGAKRIFELGSAIGYSTIALARAAGAGGKVFYTDASSEMERQARGYLKRAGLLDRVEFRIGDAVDSLEATPGLFDLIFIDIDKEDYPRALEASLPRVRRGGLLLADNALWSGKVADPSIRDSATEGIREFNRKLFAQTDYQAAILPLRDGVAIAHRRQ